MLMNYAVFNKNDGNVEIIEILSLHIWNKEELFGVRKKVSHNKRFSDNLVRIEMERKTHILTSKPFYLGLSILEIIKIVIYVFWFDYVKPKYGKKSKIMLRVYRYLYSLHKSKGHLIRYWNKVLKRNLILHIIINWKEYYLNKKTKRYLD